VLEEVDSSLEQASEEITQRFESIPGLTVIGINLLPTKKDAEDFLSTFGRRLEELEGERERVVKELDNKIQKLRTLIHELRGAIQKF
jgi:hypothetical protein